MAFRTTSSATTTSSSSPHLDNNVNNTAANTHVSNNSTASTTSKTSTTFSGLTDVLYTLRSRNDTSDRIKSSSPSLNKIFQPPFPPQHASTFNSSKNNTNTHINNSNLDPGIPRKHVIQISGPPGSGKTSIALDLTANTLRRGHRVLWITSSTTCLPVSRLIEQSEQSKNTNNTHKDTTSNTSDDKTNNDNNTNNSHPQPFDKSWLTRLTHISVNSLAQLILLFKNPPAHIPLPDCALVVIDDFSVLVTLAYNLSSFSNTNYNITPKNNIINTSNSFRETTNTKEILLKRRTKTLSRLFESMKRFATTNNLAILLNGGMKSEFSMTRWAKYLVPVVGYGPWSGKSVDAMVVLYKDIVPVVELKVGDLNKSSGLSSPNKIKTSKDLELELESDFDFELEFGSTTDEKEKEKEKSSCKRDTKTQTKECEFEPIQTGELEWQRKLDAHNSTNPSSNVLDTRVKTSSFPTSSLPFSSTSSSRSYSSLPPSSLYPYLKSQANSSSVYHAARLEPRENGEDPVILCKSAVALFDITEKGVRDFMWPVYGKRTVVVGAGTASKAATATKSTESSIVVEKEVQLQCFKVLKRKTSEETLGTKEPDQTFEILESHVPKKSRLSQEISEDEKSSQEETKQKQTETVQEQKLSPEQEPKQKENDPDFDPITDLEVSTSECSLELTEGLDYATNT